ncbi:MAG: hypothetical protein ABSD53_12585 [Terriglobales bacterium]|jgi:hypothetical protein
MTGRPGGMSGRSGAVGSGRSSGAEADRAANIRPAIHDGQWHSFGNSGSSAHGASGANSNLMARSVAGREGGFQSFGGSRGFEGGSRFQPGFGFRGGWGGGYGWGGRGWGCCGGWGWGGFGFGFGFGGPYWGAYWGPAWGLGWSPWWYDPYWYGQAAYGPYAYGGGPGYMDNWDDNPPPYRPDANHDGSQNGSSGENSTGSESPAGYLSPNYPVLHDDSVASDSGTT